MDKVNLLIVEDELMLGEELAFTLRKHNYEVTDIAPSGKKALDSIELTRPDLVLMDIGLKGDLDGIETTRKINDNYSIPVIYLTGNEDTSVWKKAINTTRSSAYIVKPYHERDLNIAIELALKNAVTLKKSPDNGEDNDQYLVNDRIFIKENNRFEKVMVHSIYCIKAEGSYAEIFTERKKYMISENLNYFEQGLDSDIFIRVHRSWLINAQRIDAFEGNRVIINGMPIPIGRKYRLNFKDKFRFL